MRALVQQGRRDQAVALLREATGVDAAEAARLVARLEAGKPLDTKGCGGVLVRLALWVVLLIAAGSGACTLWARSTRLYASADQAIHTSTTARQELGEPITVLWPLWVTRITEPMFGPTRSGSWLRFTAFAFGPKAAGWLDVSAGRFGAGDCWMEASLTLGGRQVKLQSGSMPCR